MTVVAVYIGTAMGGCASDSKDGAEESLSSGVDRAGADGHARMVAALKRIAAEPHHPFQGKVKLEMLRAGVAALSADARPAEKGQLWHKLGTEELRHGNSEKAVEYFRAAYDLLPQFRDEISPEAARGIVFSLGVAYLRWGETRNCVALHTSQSCIFPIEGSGVFTDQVASRAAIQYFRELLERDSGDVAARWLLNIAHMTVGDYPEKVPATYLIDPQVFVSDEEFPRFVDIAPDLGLNTFDLGGGAVVDDFDGDGFLDVMTSTWDTAGPARFFRNNGEGGFQDETERAGLTGILGGINLVQGDYNDDGYTDVFVVRGNWLGRDGRHPNSLLRNNGDRTFTDVTFETGLAKVNYPTPTASWGDYDNDGDLDLYVGNENDPCQLFRNNGDETFTDVAASAGVQNRLFSKGVIWGDYDGDRHQDLYVSNFRGNNRLYHNNGDGTFTDVAAALGVTGPSESFAVWFWDFDNDGALDLFVSNYTKSALADVVRSFLGLPIEKELVRLYKGDGKGGFQEVGEAQGLQQLSLAMGANFGDLDNDGFLDFYLGTGEASFEGLMPNKMYRNRGGTGFSDVTTAGGFGHLQKGHSIAFADLDNDGDQDVFEQMGGAFPGDAYGDVLYENPGFGAHWLKLKLVGVHSNRSAIGARIRLEIVEGGERRFIYRHVNSGGSFGANPLRQEIGVGQATLIEALQVFWPAPGVTQVFRDVGVDQYLEITEGQDQYRRLPLTKVTF